MLGRIFLGLVLCGLLPGVAWVGEHDGLAVYDAVDLERTGSSDLGHALARLLPSFSVLRNHVGPGGILHGVSLRGLSPDHVVVLVNGRRRHRVSFPRPLEKALQGTMGTDLRAIPVAAVERVEVLRDGTRYGAVGGVVNVVLRADSQASHVMLDAGVTDRRDGERYGVSVNTGLPAGAEGVLNLTLEVAKQGRTDRAFDTGFLDPDGANAVGLQRKVVLGEPEQDVKALFVNGMVPLWVGEFYGFGGWASRRGVSSGFFRDPVWALDRMVEPLHPDGFLPFEASSLEDVALNAGFRGRSGPWRYDVNLGYGGNVFAFGARQSVNASWAARWLETRQDGELSLADLYAGAGPGEGDSGATRLAVWSVEGEAVREMEVASRRFEMIVGAGLRETRFRLSAGDFASWGCGLPELQGTAPAVGLDADGGVVQLDLLARCGHQGFPGYSPVSAGLAARERLSASLWMDLRYALTERLSVGSVLRWEDGLGAAAGGRWRPAAGVVLRLDAATGFRAPSLPEVGFNAVAFGGPTSGADRLGSERSYEVSAGLEIELGGSVFLSADLVWVRIDDRIVRRDCAEGCVLQPGISGFYDNATATETLGLDVAIRHDRVLAGGDLTVAALFHLSETRIVKGRLQGHTRSYLAEAVPGERHRLSAVWQLGPADVKVVMDWYGATASQWVLADPVCPGPVKGEWIGGLSTGIRIGHMRLRAGVDNLLDTFPARVEGACHAFLNEVLGWGVRWSGDTPWGLAGRVFWTRVTVGF